MKVIFNAPKKEVFNYFKKGGDFETNTLRAHKDGVLSKAYWSRIWVDKVRIKFGLRKGKSIEMKIINNESTNEKTVLSVAPSIYYIIIGVLTLPLCFIGVFLIIAYFMRKSIMNKKVKEYVNGVWSEKFDVIIG